MADINITVNNNLYSVGIDTWDWTGLTVIDNGNTIIVPEKNGCWNYSQTTVGPIEFQASANSVQTLNPGAAMILAGSTANHMCNVSYTAPKTPFVLYAFCSNVSKGFPPTGTSPILFSQGHMTGKFQFG